MSLTHILIFILVVVVVLSIGKIPRIMGDVAEGIKAFKKGIKDDEGKEDPKSIENKIEDKKE